MILNNLFLILVLCGLVFSDDPCNDAIDLSNSLRSSTLETRIDEIELCDGSINPEKWYTLGGNMTTHCVSKNRCGTFAPIWLDGDHPPDEKIVDAKVCSGNSHDKCCVWNAEIKIKKCGNSFVYKLKEVQRCPMAYCIDDDPVIPTCGGGSVLLKTKHICLELPEISPPTLSKPYISAWKKVFMDNIGINATMFSFDCLLQPLKNVDPAILPGKLQMETTFKMNDVVVVTFTSDSLVNKVSMNESYLVGHLGKTLTCSVRFYYMTEKGLFSDKSKEMKSEGYYVGIVAENGEGTEIKDLTIKQGAAYNITFRPTFPITLAHCLTRSQCSPQEYVVAMVAPDLKIQTSSCQLKFSLADQVVVVKVSARTTFGRETSTSKISFKEYDHETLFRGYTLSPLTITIKDDNQQPTCRSTGDPHFSSFRGTTFDNYEVGDFNLLSVTSGRLFEIQVRQIPCGNGRVTCNCGVIAREGNSIVGLSGCDTLRNVLVFDLMRDNVNPQPIIEKGHNSYYIQFVSGISLRADIFGGNMMNIYVYGLKTDSYSGICAGRSGDFKAYRIPEDRSFFRSRLPACSKEVIEFPACSCCARKENDDVIIFSNLCDLKHFLVVDGESKTEVKLKTQEDELVGGRAQGFKEEDVFSTVDHKITNEEKAIKEITESEAKEICYNVFANSEFYGRCKEHLVKEYDQLENECIVDVKSSGDADFAKSQLTVFDRICKENIDKIIITTDEKNPLKEQIDLIEFSNQIGVSVCPVCLNGGVCRHRKCECVQGYGGIDCYHKTDAPPHVSALRGTHRCDVSTASCHIFNLAYQDIVVGDGRSIESVFEFKSKDGKLSKTVQGKASINSMGFLQLSLGKDEMHLMTHNPVMECNAYVVVKESGLKSNVLNFELFDGTCMDCSEGGCRQKSNTCLIDNQCYKSKQSIKQHFHCDPDKSTNDWTKGDATSRHVSWIVLLCLGVAVLANCHRFHHH